MFCNNNPCITIRDFLNIYKSFTVIDFQILNIIKRIFLSFCFILANFPYVIEYAHWLSEENLCMLAYNFPLKEKYAKLDPIYIFSLPKKKWIF